MCSLCTVRAEDMMQYKDIYHSRHLVQLVVKVLYNNLSRYLDIFKSNNLRETHIKMFFFYQLKKQVIIYSLYVFFEI